MNIDSIKEIMDGFDPSVLLPDLSTLVGRVELICRIAVMIGPIILLLMGLAYLFLAPKEANHYFGYQCYYGMGSVQAWRFTQRLAGLVLGVLGLGLSIAMAVLSMKFRGMETMAMVTMAAKCLIWQAVLAALAMVAINLTDMFLFDRRGEVRYKNKA